MQANYANALCHRNATPLSVAVLAPCAWGENLAWQGVLNLAKHNTAWQNSMAQQSKRNEFSVASVCGRNKAWRHYKFSTEKMGQCLGGGLLSLSLSLVARTFWHTKIFKCFVFGLLRPFCHFEHSDPTGCKAQAAAKKSTQIKRKLAIFGYFANAQYDSERVIASRFCENGVAIHKFSVIFAFWIATLALLARNDGKAKIQIFYSKFKAFHKFNSFCKFKAFYKFNSFHNFISNFRAVFTDKFNRKEELWQQLAQKAGQEQSHRLKATENAVKPTK